MVCVRPRAPERLDARRAHGGPNGAMRRAGPAPRTRHGEKVSKTTRTRKLPRRTTRPHGVVQLLNE
eukprot:5739228-Lingulodinium_polyedra.AAC.1